MNSGLILRCGLSAISPHILNIEVGDLVISVLDQFFMLFPLVVVLWRRSYCVRRKTYHLTPIDDEALWQVSFGGGPYNS